ncbi:rhomboid family protein [Bacillus sp. PS06]|uniref:rhomboid family protein n=1 Tax=Bacillus sp. PS06 TaxID=2764176 RepID=UPI00177B2D4D|nr:rhomboid family intramembrane serine protease [Bacillus sp. PS06]MBD8069138.1 rhomboid family intramembrane serine protease [Bacillus sp. PS06]
MVFRQDYHYWSTVHQLVVEYNYRVIQLSQHKNEVWLESNDKKGPSLIRIIRYDLDWGSWLKRDIEQTGAMLEELRKRQNKRKLNALNLYFSTYPPVDDWLEHTETKLFGKKEQTSIKNMIIHSENSKQGFKELSTCLERTITIEDEAGLFDYSKIDQLKHEVYTYTKQRKNQEKKIFSYGKPFFTYFFIFIQIVMFILLEANGGSMNTDTLISFGAKENFLILHGEWWRFFTPIILHIGFFHLVMNTLALYFLGTAVERIYGRARFLLLYVFAGFAGTLASFVFSPAVSAGASGAIFGCFGALLFFGFVHPSLFFRTMGTNVIAVIGINLVIGFIFPVVDNAGHIGGLVGGFLAASFLHLPEHKKYVQRMISFVITIALTIAMFYVGYTIQPTSGNPTFVIRTAQSYIEENKINDAYKILLDAEQKNKNVPAELYFYLSYTEVKLGKLTEAREHLEIVTNELPSLHEAHYNLALVYVELKDFDRAKASIERAIKEAPDQEEYKSILDTINDYLERSE